MIKFLHDTGISLSSGTYRRLGYKHIKCLDSYCKLPRNLGLYDLRQTLIKQGIHIINNISVESASKTDIRSYLFTYNEINSPL